MCDMFRARLHYSVGCTGGIECNHDRPRPSGSESARRFKASKVRSRREARRAVNRDTRDHILNTVGPL